MYFKIQKGMKRVYLAKSNKANPDIVSSVRKTLAKFDVQVVEHTGGSYSNDLLLSCDELYVIPDLSEAENDEYGKSWSVAIGKGLYEQILVFSKVHNHNDIFIITNYDGDASGLYYEDDSEYHYSIKVVDETDYITYAYLMINTKNSMVNPWNLYDYVLESNNIKDESWATELVTSYLSDTTKRIATTKGFDSIILRRRGRR